MSNLPVDIRVSFVTADASHRRKPSQATGLAVEATRES